MKNIEIVRDGGIKCDNQKCDWTDETVTREQMPDWIDKPCPKCGENVLTKEDYVRYESTMLAVDYINTFSESDMKELGFDPSDPKILAEVDTHNEIKIKIKELK